MAEVFGNWTVQLRKGMLELGILNLLNRRDHYGYELFTVMKDQLGMLVSFGTLYPVLKRLEDAGLVSTRLSDSRLGPKK